MRRIFILSTFLFSFIFTAQAENTYIIDKQHSYVLWHINHFGFSNPSGKWMAEGKLVYNEAEPDKSKVNVTIHVADVITGIPELDKHLRGKLFFDTKMYPEAHFVSDKVVVITKDTAKIYGMLTVRGITKPIILDEKLNKVGINPITNKKTIGFTAYTTLNRSDFAINALLPGLSDEVKVSIEVEAYQEN